MGIGIRCGVALPASLLICSACFILGWCAFCVFSGYRLLEAAFVFHCLPTRPAWSASFPVPIGAVFCRVTVALAVRCLRLPVLACRGEWKHGRCSRFSYRRTPFSWGSCSHFSQLHAHNNGTTEAAWPFSTTVRCRGVKRTPRRFFRAKSLARFILIYSRAVRM